ncbi:MAG TPA: bifunctional [glutamate--ammonia ligase]-adenylyl-L-tyrosine phosphorylase/[glutamate--ammonia-ligase] adenylyltransferase [Methylophilaceae bacterium]|jgi:glutamate-ammonia-ligase adenylyltransferase
MRTLDQILEEKVTLSTDEACVSHAIKCSPFTQRLLTSDAELLRELLQHLHEAWTEQAMRDWLATMVVSDEASLKRTLRKLRQRVLLRLIVRDLNHMADLQEVMRVASWLAEVSVQFALHHLVPTLEASLGQPLGESGGRQQLIVVGMGKLGGGELNVSSDIDLIFAFEEDGETSSPHPISNSEFFTRLAKKLIAAIDESTEDGFVFRVDMRLRPYGSEGPLACSFAMLEEYYQNQGREWERYAWIKGRVIAGPGRNLADLLRPFVFRKYLDYGAFASMRELKVQIQRDVNRRDMHDNIKLGRGGIREVEFIAQVFQLIRGGRDSSLQIRPTLGVLALIKAKELLQASTVDELSQAYTFLRNLEHRLQYMEDAQTQELPRNEAAQARIALAMDFASWGAFKDALEQHRAKVQLHFDELFSVPDADPNKTLSGYNGLASDVWQGLLTESGALDALKSLGYEDTTETLRRLVGQHASSRYKSLPETSRQRFDALMPLVIAQAATESRPEVTLMRVSDLLDSICRRASYLALLAEYPQALELVIKLCSASPWLAQYLSQHPILLDELLDTRNLYAAPDFIAMRAELKQRLSEVDGDVERQMDVMRHFKHAAVFRFAAKDVAGELPLRTLSDYLSELADLILQQTLETIWPILRGKHCEQPKFAVISYGKLGGKELGYASDLDIIFLYDDDAPGAGEIYARFGQRINNWLNSLTSAGMLYETDLALRPDGASGLLVSSIEAFREYQQHKAWVWEHQALTRARFSAGDVSIGQAFEQIRVTVLQQPRDHMQLKAEVIAMRQKMENAHPNHSGLFDLKHDRGGIIDVEFIVQYLVLAYADKYPQLTDNSGNIDLLLSLGKLKLIELQLAQHVGEAYRQLRSKQHAIRLQGESMARVDIMEISAHVEAVKALWEKVFLA